MEDVEQKYCDVCHTDLMQKIGDDDVTVTGLTINLTVREGAEGFKEHIQYRRIVNMFGKTEFNICHVCWLLSLGVKPLPLTP